MYAQQYRNGDPYWQTIENGTFSHGRLRPVVTIHQLTQSFLHREVAKRVFDRVEKERQREQAQNSVFPMWPFGTGQ